MDTKETTSLELNDRRLLLSFLSPEEKHGLVGSFVVDNYWETFNEAESEAIKRFRAIAKSSIQEFIKAYQDVWDFVVEINELDDLFLSKDIEKKTLFDGLSYNELKIANKLLALSLYSELEKDCLMALNKTILGELAADLKEKYGFSEEELQLLMTPSFETFFTKYHFDHLEYVITDEPEQKERLRKMLVNNFHAQDPALFELRFAEMYFSEDDDLKSLLSDHKKALIERSAKKNAFISNREELIAFEKLLEYDNFLDFEYRFNLQACPEYYLRKLLFQACQKSGIFAQYSKPLELKDAEFIDGVNTLVTMRADKYVITLSKDIAIADDNSFGTIKKKKITGSKAEIINNLKSGSPCLAIAKSKKPAETILILGYDKDTLLAQNNKKEQLEINETHLTDFRAFYVLEKHDAKQIKALEASIQKLINRTPYLDRTEYEHAF